MPPRISLKSFMALKLTLLYFSSIHITFHCIYLQPYTFFIPLLFLLSLFILYFHCDNSQDSGLGTPVTLRIDKQGFYLYWVDQNHEMDFLDIATIRDVRTGQYAKKPKVNFTFYSDAYNAQFCDLSFKVIIVTQC
jgi:hypothetical protein